MRKNINDKYTKEDIANAKKTIASFKGVEKILSHLYFAREDMHIVQSMCKANKTYAIELPFVQLSAKLLDNVMICLVNRINDCRAVLGMEKIDIKKGIRG